IIAGAGPKRGVLERLVRRLALGGAVRFVGTISEAEKAQLLASADVACFPARGGESFGVVILEALAAGSGAVIAGANRGYHELLDGVGGVVATGDLGHALATMLADENCRLTL